ncbi:MAG: 6-carboxytetrahydropterin synthase [Cyclobacteriaceae bacterium]|nr:6-carboxytetrahydropterin synthase [Cyclobacteriaceae bacterium]
MKTAVYRKERFNAAHRIFRKDWSDERNLEVFGKCANPNYHGHNYELVVRLAGVIDQEIGYVMDLKILSELIRNEIINRFDHKNLNLDCIEFKETIPTAENIAKIIWEILRSKIDEKIDLKIILYETERNFVEYPAGE